MAPSAKTENKLDAPGFDVKVPRDDKDAAAKDFKALDFWGQFDAAVALAAKPNDGGVPLFIIGLLHWCVHAAVCIGLTYYFAPEGTGLWDSAFHDTLLTNVIAYDAIANHNGYHWCYGVLAGGPT